MIKIITLRDRREPDEVNWTIVAETSLTEDILQGLVEDIIEEFENSNFDNWTFEDIAKELEKRGKIKVIESDTIELWL